MYYVLCYDVQGLGLHNHDDHDHDHDHSGVETMVWKMLMTCLAIWGFFNLQAVLDTLSRAVITTESTCDVVLDHYYCCYYIGR